ncbi:Hephaestin [Acipenser ruthenus]|uniref:Hephaestin n=1 Tax=Acipenser ruthenus TaxID=7906 RepID=A0A444USB2_ACIRT|nr:Hephaestin [Acipenser ruthenus]
MSLVLRAFCFLNLLVSVRGATRLYFLGIREIEWDYIPTGRNEIIGQNFTEEEEAANFLSGGADRIGSVYKKAVYKQYSDSTYSTEVTQPTWLGFLGALYPDLMSGSAKLDDAVPPGGSHKYTWNVNVDHAPTADDPSCLTWAYHSHVDAPRDIASGLIGALLTCKPAINGYMFGNLPGLEMCAGNSISWHLLGMGSETDVHTAFFHGQALTVRHQRTDVVSLFPATFVTGEMVPRNIGKWLLSCNEHLPGPLIRAEVGDITLIVFKNKASRKYSLHAHGAQETNRGNIPAAEPGEIITYRWNIPERSGPARQTLLVTHGPITPW